MQALTDALRRHRPGLAIVDSIALVPASRVPTHVPPVALMHMLPSALVAPSRRAGMQAAEKRLLSRATVVVAVSRDLASRLPASQVEVIPPGSDRLPFVPGAEHQPWDPVHFLCVANWTPAKGIHLLVEAFTKVSAPAVLDLVGAHPLPAYDRRVLRAIRAHGLDGRVRVHGPADAIDLSSHFSVAGVFVLPSLEEGYGTVIAEALHAGVPVVASALPPIREMVTEECGMLVPPGDVPALAQAMQRLNMEFGTRREMERAARARARSLPVWADTEERFVRLAKRLLSASAPLPLGEGSGEGGVGGRGR